MMIDSHTGPAGAQDTALFGALTRSARVLLVLLCATALGLGCTRVPGKSLPKLQVSAAKKKSKSAQSTAAVQVEAAQDNEFEELMDEQFAEEDVIEPLCYDACEHWATLRHPYPRHMRALKAPARDAMTRVYDHQRAQHSLNCTNACIRADNRARAQCILLTETGGEIARCLQM